MTAIGHRFIAKKRRKLNMLTRTENDLAGLILVETKVDFWVFLSNILKVVVLGVDADMNKYE